MGLFNRQPRNGPTAAGTTTTTTNGSSRQNRQQGESYSMASKPTFGQWIKYTWLDILTMAAMGAVGLGVYMANPAPTRSFAVNFSDGEIVYPQFAYPLRKEIVPIWLAALLASLIPIFIILCMQVRVRSFWDANNAILGLFYSLISAAVFQVFIKWLIGGLRPHFLAVCKPDISLASNNPGDVGAGYNGAGFNQIYYTREICTGDIKQINDSLESMPSGHSTAAFAGFIFLYLYLNAKLKVWSNYHPAMWKLLAVYAPVLGACLIAGALTIDEFHNWYDCFAGAVIGTVMAFSAYRMVFASIFDWRYNHIPLHRSTAMEYGNSELSHLTFTRRGGFGHHGATGYTDKHHGGAGPLSGGHGGVANDQYAHAGVINDQYAHGGITNDQYAHGGATNDQYARKPVGSPAGLRNDHVV